MENIIQSTISSSAITPTNYVRSTSGKTQPTSDWLNCDIDTEFLTVNHPGHNTLLCTRPEWQDPEYRRAYMEAAIEQGIAWQIKTNRKKRNWTQLELAKSIGTHQSAVARLEDPDYGNQSLDTLTKVAHAFDCALLIKLVPYSTLAKEAQSLSPNDLFAAGYDSEIKEGNHVF